MTRKDYVLIAKALAATRECGHFSKEAYVITAWALAVAFHNESPKFKKRLFLQACGIDPSFIDQMEKA